jgi:hypothetical protein
MALGDVTKDKQKNLSEKKYIQWVIANTVVHEGEDGHKFYYNKEDHRDKCPICDAELD